MSKAESPNGLDMVDTMQVKGVLRKPPEVLSHKDVDGEARKAYDELFADYVRIKELLIELGEFWNPIRNAFPGLKGCPCWRDVGIGDDSRLPAQVRVAKESEAIRLLDEYNKNRTAYVTTYRDRLGTNLETYRKLREALKEVAKQSSVLDAHWREAMRTLLEEAASTEDSDVAKLINESFPKMSFWEKASSKLLDLRIGLRDYMQRLERQRLEGTREEH